MENKEISYLFRTYNGNKYVLKFGPNKKIEDAINYFQINYNFRDVEIYPIEDLSPNYEVDKSKLLRSFSSKRFLLCARYIRISKPYDEQNEDIDEDCYMKTPIPNRNIARNKKERNLLIQQFNNNIIANPLILNEVLEVAKKINEDHFHILNKNQDRIKQLLMNGQNSPSIDSDD